MGSTLAIGILLNRKGNQNMGKFVCIPEDEKSTWYVHMQYFMTKKFGVKEIIYGKKYIKKRMRKVKEFFLIHKNIIRQINGVNEKSQLFFFHPMPYFWNMKKVRRVLNKKKIFLIGFVCDIALLHLNDEEHKKITKKISAYLKDRLLKKYDVILVPTIRMKNYLVGKGIDRERIMVHGLYDYHISIINETRKYTDNIIIAGDLSCCRNNYIYQLHNLSNLCFNLYGYGFDKKYKKENISYYGLIGESELNLKMDGRFGLCWYGNKMEMLTGFSAEYIKINSPHKVSLYIANNIPVIVSDEAGIANYIKENHLGIIIHNLKELPEILEAISDEEYTDLLDHVMEEGKKLRKGCHLEKSLLKIDKMCSFDKGVR